MLNINHCSKLLYLTSKPLDQTQVLPPMLPLTDACSTVWAIWCSCSGILWVGPLLRCHGWTQTSFFLNGLFNPLPWGSSPLLAPVGTSRGALPRVCSHASDSHCLKSQFQLCSETWARSLTARSLFPCRGNVIIYVDLLYEVNEMAHVNT